MMVHLVSDRFSVGGGMVHIFQIVRGLPRVRFRVFARSGPGDSGSAVPALGEKFRGLDNVELVYQGFSPALVLADNPDLIHFHHLRPLFRFYRNPVKKYPIPVVFTAHGLHLHKFEFPGRSPGEILLNRLKYRMRYSLEKSLLSRADRVIAVSREDRDFMEKKYGLNHVIYLTNGIEPPGPRIDAGERSRIRKSMHFGDHDFLFVTVARFDFQKGYDFLVRTIATMKEFFLQKRAGFVFAGDGSEMPRIRMLARKLGVSSLIRFLGERSDAGEIMQAGDVFLLPSRWEGLPIVLLECGLLRVPVIASDTTGNREIIGDQNGILFENLNQEALAAVLRDAVNGRYDFNRFRDSLYREVRHHYSLKKMIDGLMAVYRSLSGLAVHGTESRSAGK